MKAGLCRWQRMCAFTHDICCVPDSAAPSRRKQRPPLSCAWRDAQEETGRRGRAAEQTGCKEAYSGGRAAAMTSSSAHCQPSSQSKAAGVERPAEGGVPPGLFALSGGRKGGGVHRQTDRQGAGPRRSRERSRKTRCRRAARQVQVGARAWRRFQVPFS